MNKNEKIQKQIKLSAQTNNQRIKIENQRKNQIVRNVSTSYHVASHRIERVINEIPKSIPDRWLCEQVCFICARRCRCRCLLIERDRLLNARFLSCLRLKMRTCPKCIIRLRL